MRTKHFKSRIELKQGAENEGDVVAAVSVFNVIDDVQEVVLPSFFTDGQPLLMAAWGHNWGGLNPGRGMIKVVPTQGEFHGRFYLDTESGREHYLTVKNNAELQEWSFGFEVTQAHPGVIDGQDVWFLERGTIFEASPVLVGANRETYTVDIKGLPMAEDGERVRLYVATYAERVKALAALRAKEGRAISEERRKRIATVADDLDNGAKELRTMLEETAPKSGDDEGKGALITAEELGLIRARLTLQTYLSA